MSAVTDYNPWGVAWQVNKGAIRVGRKGYHMAQNAGMRYTNWRRKGAGSATAAMPGPNPLSPRPAKKSSGKNWTTDEESFRNTTTSVTTYTRKRTK